VELPHLERLWKKYSDEGLSVIAIEATGETSGAKEFINEKNLTFHLLENQKDQDVVWGLFNGPGFPSSFLVDQNGKILFYRTTYKEGDEVELEQMIIELLNQG
jgi:peroxiredoxin